VEREGCGCRGIIQETKWCRPAFPYRHLGDSIHPKADGLCLQPNQKSMHMNLAHIRSLHRWTDESNKRDLPVDPGSPAGFPKRHWCNVWDEHRKPLSTSVNTIVGFAQGITPQSPMSNRDKGKGGEFSIHDSSLKLFVS
jgi:hypothetical protein